MLSDKIASYRKTVYPWYDTNPTCWIILVIMVFAFFFGMLGISVAYETEAYQQHLWAPVMVMGLSSMVIITVSARLIIRYITQHSK